MRKNVISTPNYNIHVLTKIQNKKTNVNACLLRLLNSFKWFCEHCFMIESDEGYNLSG